MHSCPGSRPRAMWESHRPPSSITAPLLSKDRVTSVDAVFYQCSNIFLYIEFFSKKKIRVHFGMTFFFFLMKG